MAIDGGELPYAGGMFNALDRVSQEQWDMMEQIIRQGNQESKNKKE